MGIPSADEVLGPLHNTHLTTFRRCKQKFKYAFIEGIQPKTPSLPLTRGIWIHYCLEAQFLRWGILDKTLLETPETINIDGVGEVKIVKKGKSLRLESRDKDNEFSYTLSAAGMLELLTNQVWSRLFPQEHEKYTEDDRTLPEAVKIILEEYFYYWKKKYHPRKFRILLVEQTWKREYKGVEFEGRLDYVIQQIDSGRIICGDWKSTKSEPHPEYKFLESQLNLYPWGVAPILAEHGIDKKLIESMAVEFDYLSTKLPTVPSKNQDGSLSRRKINTTRRTLLIALKDYGLTWSEEQVDDFLLRNEREFFSCKPFPRSKKVVRNLLEEHIEDAVHMAEVLQTPSKATRTVTRNCNWDCDFMEICKGELYGHNVKSLRVELYEPRTNNHAGVMEKDNGPS